MFAKRFAVPTTLVVSLVILPGALAAQRTPLSKPQVGMQVQPHDHLARQQAVDGLLRATFAHQNLLRRLASDHQFADDLELAAQRGDVNTATALFAQAAGVPVNQVQVERAPETMGNRDPEFRVENAAVWTSGRRVMYGKSTTFVKLCLFGYCWVFSGHKEAQ